MNMFDNNEKCYEQKPKIIGNENINEKINIGTNLSKIISGMLSSKVIYTSWNKND